MSQTDRKGASTESLPSLSSLPAGKSFSDHLEELLASAAIEVRHFAPGEAVFHEGDRGACAFFIRSGSVDILCQAPDGRQRFLQRLRRGELFGEMALLDQTRRSASAVIRDRADLFVITPDEMMTLLEWGPQMVLWMFGLSSRRLRVLTRMVATMEQVQEVNLKILAAQEEERRRIGRDIHDGVAQSFSDLILRLQSTIQLLGHDPGRVRPALEDLENGLRDSLEEIRELIRNLYSKDLRITGLVGAIEHLLGRVPGPDDPQISFEHHGMKDKLPATLEAMLFGLVQEALSNARKHAAASEIRIDLRRESHNVVLVVEDNGRGFALGKLLTDPAKQDTYGLLSMQERTDLVGGIMEIDSRPGTGTRLRFSVPLFPA